MKTTRLQVRVGVLVALSLTAASIVDGCGGSQQSLIVIALKASPSDTTLKSVVIDVEGTSKTFPLTAGLTATPTSFGVYVPAAVKGSVTIKATARHASMTDCDGYSGEGQVMIDSVGVTKNVLVPMAPANVCPTTGAAGSTGAAGEGAAGTGAAGTTGGAGTTGAAGTGAAGTGAAGTGTAGTTPKTDGGVDGTGAAGTTAAAGRDGGMDAAVDAPPKVIDPPTLTKCTEYDHSTVTTCISEGDAGDWAIWSVAFSPDGKTLLTAGDDSRIKLWKVNGSTLTADGRVLTSDGQAYVAFSPDGTMAAGGSHNGRLIVWNTSNWGVRTVLAGHTGTIYGVAFSPDSKQVISVSSSLTMTVHSVDSPTALRTFDLPHAGWALAVSPVRTATEFWISAGYSDGSGELLNLGVMPADGRLITIDSSGSESMAFSPDGKLAATGGDDGIANFWKIPPVGTAPMPVLPTITTLSTAGNPQTHNGMAFSPDGRHIAIATGALGNGGRLGIWDVATRQTRGEFFPTWYPNSVAWSPAGNVLVGGEAACGKVVVCAD